MWLLSLFAAGLVLVSSSVFMALAQTAPPSFQFTLNPPVVAPGQTTRGTITLIDRYGRAIPAPVDMVLNITMTSLGDFQLAKARWVREIAAEGKVKLLDWPPASALPLKVISSDRDLLNWMLPTSLEFVSRKLRQEMKTPFASSRATIVLGFGRRTEFSLGLLQKGKTQVSFLFSAPHRRGTFGFLVEAGELSRGTAVLWLQSTRGDRSSSERGFRARTSRAYAASGSAIWLVSLKFDRRDDGIADSVWEYDVTPWLAPGPGAEQNALTTPCDVKLKIGSFAAFLTPDGRRAKAVILGIPGNRNQPVRPAHLISEAGYWPHVPFKTASVTVEPHCSELVPTEPEFLIDFPPRPYRIELLPNVRTALANGHDRISFEASVVDRTGAVLNPAMEGRSQWRLVFRIEGAAVIDKTKEEFGENQSATTTVQAFASSETQAVLIARLMETGRPLRVESPRVDFRNLWSAAVVAILVGGVLGAAPLMGSEGRLGPAIGRAVVGGLLAFAAYFGLYYLIVPRIEVTYQAAKFLVESDKISWSPLAGIPIGLVGLAVHKLWPHKQSQPTPGQ